MNILILSHEYPPIGGGGANACFYLAGEFARAGCRVTVLTAQSKGQETEEVTRDRVHVCRVPCRRKNIETSSLAEMASYLVHAWKKAGGMARAGHFDICLAFFGVPSGPVAWYLKKRFRLPYVVRLGGGDIPGAQKRFKYLYKILGPAVRRIWKEASGLLANSEGLRRRALQFEDAYKVGVIANGVDDGYFVPGRAGSRRTAVKVLFVSRLIEGKGLQHIIPEWKEVSAGVKERCGMPAELAVVGDGPYRKRLEEIACRAGCAGLVRFEGRKNKEQVRRYYQDADVFILPSLSEGMPNVVLEAMACGLPVLTTPCEGSAELVRGNGIISSLEDFPGHLVRLCSDRALRERMGKEGLALVRKQFRWKEISCQYMEFMQEAAERQ